MNAGQTKLQTVHEAIQVFERGKGKQKWMDYGAEISYSSTATADLLAVVVNLSLRGSDPPSGELWIADQSSGDNNLMAAVSLYDSRTVKAIQEKKLQVGSVVRFNGLSLKRKMIKRGEAKSKTRTITYELQHPWENPHQGAQWYPLGHVAQNNSEASTARIPPEMETDKRQIRLLIEWYLRSKFNSNGLAPVPCQRRYLEDMLSSLGVVSNVVAKVTNLETISEASPVQRPKKKRRQSPSSSRKLLLVSVSDGKRTTIPFLDEDSRFKAKLSQAFKSGQPVMLNGVVCRQGREVRTSWWADEQGRSDEIVLVPTAQTDIVLLPKEAALQGGRLAMGQETQAPFSATQGLLHSSRVPNPKQRLTATPQSQQSQGSQPQNVFTATQTQPASQQRVSHNLHLFTATQPSEQQQAGPPNLKDATQTLEAHLQSIDFLDLKLTLTKGHRALRSPSKLLSVLIRKDGNDYRKATLVLGTDQGKLRVDTDSNGMRNLCGGLGADDLKKQPELGTHMNALIQGLLEERTPLRWKLKVASTTDCDYSLLRVTMVEL